MRTKECTFEDGRNFGASSDPPKEKSRPVHVRDGAVGREPELRTPAEGPHQDYHWVSNVGTATPSGRGVQTASQVAIVDRNRRAHEDPRWYFSEPPSPAPFLGSPARGLFGRNGL